MSVEQKGLVLVVLKAANAALNFVLGAICLPFVFGASRAADVLFIALFLAVVLGRELARVISVPLVRCLVEAQEREEDSAFVATFQVCVLGVAVGLWLIMFLGAPVVIRLVCPGFDAATAAEAARLLRVLSPSLLCLSLFGSAQGFFYAARRFYAPEVAQIVWRLVALAALFLWGRRYGVEAYGAGLAVASFAQWILLLLLGRRWGYRLMPPRRTRLDFRALRAFWKGAAVVFCAMALAKLTQVVDRMVVSYMAAGSVAAFSYASRLAQMVPMLVSTSILLPFLPEVSRVMAQSGDSHHLAKQGSLYMIALGVLFGATVFWAARDMVEFLMMHGKFSKASADAVILAVRAFALGIPSLFCVQCLKGRYIVERNMRAVVTVSVLAIVIRVAGNLLLRRHGAAGIALSVSLTSWVVAGYLWVCTRTARPIVFAWGRFVVMCGVLYALLFVVPWRFLVPHALLRLCLGGGAALGMYLLVMGPAIRRMQGTVHEVLDTDPGVDA